MILTAIKARVPIGGIILKNTEMILKLKLLDCLKILMKVIPFAIKFSEENNIVKSKEWANLMIETGKMGNPEYKIRVGKKHSEEAKEKIRQKALGRPPHHHSPETIEQIASKNRGKKRSEKTKEKMRQKALGRSYGKQSTEWIEKRTAHRLGIPLSELTRRKISEANKSRITKKEQAKKYLKQIKEE